jgi:DNA repair exonuclease SbcCD ATPase subunit
MKSLTTLRDELADKIVSETGVVNNVSQMERDRIRVRQGIDALLSHLEGAAGEFDLNLAVKECLSFTDNIPFIMLDKIPPEKHITLTLARDLMIALARWQFEQDRARIGLAEHKVSELEQRLVLADEGFKTVLEENATIKQLEARLAGFAHNPQEGLIAYNGETWLTLGEYDRMRERLEAKLTECSDKYLECAGKYSGTVDKLAAKEDSLKELEIAHDALKAKLAASEARVRELEAKLAKFQPKFGAHGDQWSGK